MSKIQANTSVLEDGDAALLQQGDAPGEAEIVGEDEVAAEEEFVDLNATDTPVADPAAKPAAVVKPAVVKPVAAAAADDEIPAEFRGKSQKELVRMYQEAHSTIGRQGTELGDYRRKADQVIQASLRVLEAQKTGRQPSAADLAASTLPNESEIFAKPIDSINKLVENHPIIQEIRRTLGANAASETVRRAEQSSSRFNQAHPDAAEVMRDPEFRAWASASPIRRDLLLRAHNQYDFDAGDEVFSTWKALKGRPQAAAAATVAADPGAPGEAEVKAAAQTLARARNAKVQAASQAAAAQAAAAPTGGASAAGGAAGGSKKIYRRADVIKLMSEDSERYEALSGEIQKAYEEGRVR